MNRDNRSIGLTESEKYLGELCKKNFLSLWSHQNIFRKQGPSGNPGKELCDLLVVFGDQVLIFSDKHCQFPKGKDINLNWSRWFRRTVKESADQLWEAERWIKNFPDRLFLDQKCTQPFVLTNSSTAQIHLICVAHGVSSSCRDFFGGGSGSLMLDSEIKNINSHISPFTIGDLDSTKTFVHVFDDTTLDLILNTLDTLNDFASYLRKKEHLFRSRMKVFTTGEEDLLPYYLTRIKDEVHDFDFPEDADAIFLGEGEWEKFCNNPQRKAQIEENKVSYFIDSLIEQFNFHTTNEASDELKSLRADATEKIMRFFATETRFRRRSIAEAILGCVQNAPKHMVYKRLVAPLEKTGVYYMIVAFPWNTEFTDTENREMRRDYLYSSCMVVKSLFPEAEDIVGFATESGRGEYGSEDAVYLDGRIWNENLQKEALRLNNELHIFTNPKITRINHKEFPDVPSAKNRKEGLIQQVISLVRKFWKNFIKTD